MPACQLHLTGSRTVEQGATWSRSLTMRSKTTGLPFNLTGYTASAQIRHDYIDATPSASFTCSINSPPTSGTISLFLPASGTMNIPACLYRWDLEITSGSIVSRVAEGRVNISPNVTR